jgi:hypothetical protein
MKKGLLAAVASLLVCTGAALAGAEPTSHDDYWVDAGYLIWWFQGMPVPPLVTTGPLATPPTTLSGILGQNDTVAVVGNGRLEEPIHQGGRVSIGTWIGYDHNVAAEGGFFGLFQKTRTDIATSDIGGNPLLARPVIDERSGQETVLFVSAPNAFAAPNGITVTSKTSLMGAEGNLLYVPQVWENPYVNLLGGFRWLQLDEHLDITQESSVLQSGVGFFKTVPMTALNTFDIGDHFHTRNDFYGPQVGVRWGCCWCGFAVSIEGKVALGVMREQVQITGRSTVTSPLGQTLSAPGGVFALPSNIGDFSRNQFSAVPGVDATITYEISPQWHVLVGYSCLCATEVVRPGGQIDRTIDRTQLPTSQGFDPAASNQTRPAFPFHGESFWAQGLTLGVSLSF